MAERWIKNLGPEWRGFKGTRIPASEDRVPREPEGAEWNQREERAKERKGGH